MHLVSAYIKMSFIWIGFLIFYSYISPVLSSETDNICKGFKCTCCEVENQIHVRCDSKINRIEKDLQPIIQLLKGRSIKSVSIRKCHTVTTLGNIFSNVSIQQITTHCPFKTLNSLSEIRSLRNLHIVYAKFFNVPKTIRNLQKLRILNLSHGKLSRIEYQFSNLTHLQRLNVAWNRIRYIYKNAFRHNKDLYNLDLSGNHLVRLHASTLLSNLNLRELFLNNNKLLSLNGLVANTYLTKVNLRKNSILHLDFLMGNYSYIEYLDLGLNPLLCLKSFTFTKIHVSIEVLKMDRCHLSKLPSRILDPLTSLQDLDFSYNKIRSIPEGFFDNLKNIKIVKLIGNYLRNVDGVFKETTNLQILHLSHNDIDDLNDSLQYVPNLEELDVSYNQLKVIRADNFRHSSSIKTLDLACNHIASIESEAFVPLQQLTSLRMEWNKIYSLNGSMQILKNLQFLLLTFNELRIVHEFDFKYLKDLKSLDLSNNQIRSVDKAFRNLTSMRILSLFNNSLTTLSRISFPDIFKLQVFETAKNNWICDCRLLWIKKFLVEKRFIEYDKPFICDEPSHFHAKKLAYVPVGQLSEWQNKCPQTCSCTCEIENEDDYIIKVECTSRMLEKVPWALPKKTGYLDFNHSLTADSFSLPVGLYKDLKHLNLEGNHFRHVDVGEFGNLLYLKLAGNRLERFFENPAESIQEWTLSDNPWICDCETLPFRSWLLSHQSQVIDINETRCSSNHGREDVDGKIIISLSEADLCSYSRNTYIIIIAVVSSAILLSIGACCLVYCCCCYQAKAWLFSHGITRLKKEEVQDFDAKYDAFISVSAEDFHLVENYIIPELENKAPYYTLFEPRRNLPSEEAFNVDILMEEVNKSKKIIVILSGNYILDHSLSEFLAAVSKDCLDGKSGRLILIVDKSLPPVPEEHPVMTAMASARNLRMDQKLFWEMLRFAMPLKEVKSFEDADK